MEDKLKYVNNDLSELNFKLSSLYDILKIKEIANVNQLKELTQILSIIKENEQFFTAGKNLLPDISQIVSTLTYDLSELKNKLIKSDEEIKQNINAYDLLLNFGSNSVREKEELKLKRDNEINELNKYTVEIKQFNRLGYKGKLDINNEPVETINVAEQTAVELNQIDVNQKNLISSMKIGFKSAGNLLSSAISESIIPLSKVNSLTEQLLHTFIEAASKALLMKTIFGGLDVLFSNGLSFGSSGNSLPISDIFPLPDNSINNFYSGKNSEQLKSNLNYYKEAEITLNIPKVEFRQKGYDLHAIIKKAETKANRYL